jgi:DNA-binding HxlR family transcriptional regulator
VDFAIYYDTLNIFKHRWTLEILTSLNERPSRYTDLMQTINPTPHPKSLNDALRRLQDRALVSHATDGDGSLYELTDAGQEILPTLLAFLAEAHRWSQRYTDTQPRASGS